MGTRNLRARRPSPTLQTKLNKNNNNNNNELHDLVLQKGRRCQTSQLQKTLELLPSETDPESTWPVCRSSDQRRSTSAYPTCHLSLTKTSPSRLSTLSTRDGLRVSSSPPRRKLIPTSSSSPDLLSTRTDTGLCGSSLCSDAPTHSRSSTRLRSARRSTLDAELELSDSTESDRSRWLASSSESKLS